MYFPVGAVILAGLPLIAAHGKVAVMTGDMGGNGTALAIQGAVIPGAGRNKVTEPDTTVFAGRNADACGRTNGGGANTDLNGLTQSAMQLSGNQMPQVSAGGSLSGTLHVVTSDGFGPYSAQVNEDGTAQNWKEAEVTTQVPGTRGNGRKTQNRSLWTRVDELLKRATNINEDHPIAVKLPADMKCTGNLAGQPNTCIVRIVNPSNAGPFGGCVPVQQAQPGAQPAAAPAPAPAPGTARARKFRA